jgi:hypothetical protein
MKKCWYMPRPSVGSKNKIFSIFKDRYKRGLTGAAGLREGNFILPTSYFSLRLTDLLLSAKN